MRALPVVLLLVSGLAAAERPDPYLLLVTFGAPALRDWTEAQARQADGWPYAGVASILVGGYDTAPVPSAEAFASAVERLRGQRVKVWPWVFLNRLIGRGAGEAHEGAVAAPYFQRIRGWDLEDRTGARSDFLALWRLGLRLARQLGAPGVAFDPETYNDYSTYQLANLARLGGWTPAQAEALCRRLGADLAAIVAEEYPDAVIWSFFGDVGGPRTASLVLAGLLDELTRRKLGATVVDGGETAVGYYHPSAESLTAALVKQGRAVAAYDARFGGRPALGGTIAPYPDPARLTGWLKQASEQGKRVYPDAEAFAPNFDALFDRTRWVWVYGASAGGYNPFSPRDAAGADALHAVLARQYARWRQAYRWLPLPAPPDPPRRELHRAYVSQPLDLGDLAAGDPRSDLHQPELTIARDPVVTCGPDPSLRLAFRIDWQGPAGAKYLKGWPMARHQFRPPLDLTGWDRLEFQARIDSADPLPKPPLKYGLTEGEAGEPRWQDLPLGPLRTWFPISLPLEAVGPREQVTALTFYLAEAWYRDGDHVTFWLDRFALQRQTTPELADWRVDPLLAVPGAPVTVRYRLRGDVLGRGLRLRWQLVPVGATRPVAEATAPVAQAEGTLPLDTAALPPGGYRLTGELIGADGQVADAVETGVARVP